MGADFEPERGRIAAHQPVDGVGCQGLIEPAGAIVADRSEEGAAVVAAVPGDLEVVMDQRVGSRVQPEIARLFALAGDAEMRNAAPRMPEVADLELTELFAPERVIEQGREDRAIAFPFGVVFPCRRVPAWCRQQIMRMVIAERLRLAFAAFDLRPPDAFDRIVGDGVPIAEIVEERGERREAMPDRGAAELPPRQAMICARGTARNSSGRGTALDMSG